MIGRNLLLMSVLLLACPHLSVNSEPVDLKTPLIRDSYMDELDQRFRVDLQSDKKIYLPGEVVSLKFKISNQSSQEFYIYPGSNAYEGNMKVVVSHENREYKNYRGTTWGMKDSSHDKMALLKNGEFISSEADVLVNVRDNTGIQTDYAFPEPGTYLIKAVLYDPRFEKKIESEPIEIKIENPTGVELLIWNQIKDDGDCAYFSQTKGVYPVSPNAERTIRLMESIIQRYPLSRYTPAIRAALEHQYEMIKKFK